MDSSREILLSLSFAGRSELELIGAVALIVLVAHLFVEFVWPSCRAVCRVVWTDIIAGIRRVREDLRSL
jgi:hypothetical protein